MAIIDLFYTLIIPIGLVAVMIGMGLSLTPGDLKRVVLFPRAAAIGLFGQLILLPAIAFSIAILFSPPPAIAVGLIIVAACPGGVTSNTYAFASRADVALSVTLTAIASFITVFTIPALAYLGMRLFLDNDLMPDLPVLAMIRKLSMLTVIPIAVGMFARSLWPGFADKMIEPMRKFAFTMIMIIVIGGTISAFDVIRDNIAIAGAAALTLNAVAMLTGYGLAKAFRLPIKQVVSITYEVGVQNLTLALTVVFTILQQPPLAVAALIYALFMKITALSFMAFTRKPIRLAEQTAAGGATESEDSPGDK